MTEFYEVRQGFIVDSSPLATMVTLDNMAGVASPVPTGKGGGLCRGSDQEAIVPGVKTKDYWVHFRVPDGLMPDKQFDGRPAKLQVHRVQPDYRPGQSPSSVPAVVLIHGRTVPGPVVFDLRDPATGGGDLNLSVQVALAKAGIDTFAPSLLGYGRSTRFDEGLNDPGNASLRACGGTSSVPEGCDSTVLEGINPLDQQGQQNPTLLWVNPLGGQRRRHSSNFRFARTDVWVRDIDHVIEDAIKKTKTNMVTLHLARWSWWATRSAGSTSGGRCTRTPPQ